MATFLGDVPAFLLTGGGMVELVGHGEKGMLGVIKGCRHLLHLQ